MAIDMGNSEIAKFFKLKTLFITGGTGFVGRVLIEHILRKCEVQRIYVLVRPKKGVEPKERKHGLFNVPLFDKLRAIKPDFADSIVFVDGDVSLPGLGIDEVSREQLMNEANVVFHAAASVNLQSNLKKAASINVHGTREMCRLCSKMKKLEAFVYVSTAYSQGTRERTDEIIYDAPISADDLLKITETLSVEQIDGITKNILCGWPNSYTFSKAVSEGLLKTYVDQMPICVVRPGLVISTRSDPIVGWVDNVYGPIGFVSGTAAGIIRVSNVDSSARTELVPADFVSSALIAAAHKTGKDGLRSDVAVYNIVTAPENSINYGEFCKICTSLRDNHPPSFSMWYITHTCIKNRYLYLMATFWFHLFPAALTDVFLKLAGKKPKLMKIYKKIHAFLDSVSFVSLRTWTFGDKNIRKLREEMNETDKELFDFDMSGSNVSWSKLIPDAVVGISFYLFKDDILKSSTAAKRKQFWLHILHRIVQIAYVAMFYWLLKITVSTIHYAYNVMVIGTRYAVCEN